MKPPTNRARLWSSLLLLGTTLALPARAQDEGAEPAEPAEPAPAAADERAVEVSDALREARKILADATEDVPILILSIVRDETRGLSIGADRYFTNWHERNLMT